jgi:hypothetical protein
MKKLLIEALDIAYDRVLSEIPQTKTSLESRYISDIEPLKLGDYIKENNIPDNCYFAIDGDYISLEWEVQISMTPNDKEKFLVQRFGELAYQEVFKILTKNGYKRIPIDYSLFHRFNYTNLYKMYQCKSWNMLINYYSLLFEEVEK